MMGGQDLGEGGVEVDAELVLEADAFVSEVADF